MSDWDIGLSTGCFLRTPISDCLEAVRDAGFERIEVCSYPEHFDYRDPRIIQKSRALMQRLGLIPHSFHAPYGAHLDISSPDQDGRRSALEEIERAAAAAAELGVRWFVLHPGPDIEGRPPPAEYLHRLHTAARGVERIARRCGELGMGTVLENMLPHLIFGDASSFSYLFGAVQNMNLRTCLDTGHANCADNPRHVLDRLSGHLALVHANDNFAQRDDHLPPGKGNIDWAGLLTSLGRLRFNGVLMLELAGETGKNQEDVLREARQAAMYLKERYPGSQSAVPGTEGGSP